MEPDLNTNLSSRTTWLRLVYMIVFGAIFYLAAWIMCAIAILQFLLKLFTGAVNVRLQTFGNSLGAYFHLMVAFLTFRTEEMPFPFSPWPDAGNGGNAPARPDEEYDL